MRPLVESPETALRRKLVYLLFRFQEQSAVEMMISRLINDPSAWVRSKTIFVLGPLKEQRMVQLFIRSLQDESPNVQINAMYALAKHEQGAEEILRLIKEHPRPSVRRHAFTALNRMGQLPDFVSQELRLLVQHGTSLCQVTKFLP